MNVSSVHILRQSQMLGALSRTAFAALRQGLRGHGPGPAVATAPGPEVRRRVAPLPRALVADYVRYLGGDPRAYGDELPPHLFPQWCMPALSRALEGVPYPLLRVINGGCRVQVNAPLPVGEPLEVRAWLEHVDDDGRRAVLHERAFTGPSKNPEALAIDVYAIVPYARAETNGAGNGREPKARQHTRVPDDARELARIGLARDAGLSFALLTGDFNPIHWIGWSARAAGFHDVILHGFGTLAHAWEGLNRSLFLGDVHAIASFDAKLTRPLVLPHEVGLYVLDQEAFVGDAAGGPAYMSAVFATRGD